MSHEIRTPLNAIIGMTTVGKSTGEAERKEYCLTKISEASRHLLGIINDILDMSKIEADKFELCAAECNVEKMLQRVIDIVNYRVEEKNQNFVVEIGGDVPAVILVDEQRLAQVITNLLSNAVKFTPEGGCITLKAAQVREEDDISTLSFTVKDTGIGISEEQQKRLFTPFEQADSSVSRKFGGTGLGLAICRSIVEMMGGRIWIESEPGRGAAFIFEITARNCAKKNCGPAIDRKLAALVVNEAPEMRELFVSLLGGHGIICETAKNREEALLCMDRRSAAPFDLIFVDWRLPGTDGVQLTREIMRRDDKKPAVVLVVSSHWSAIEAEARAAGVSRFLQKPVLPSALADCISACLAPEHHADTRENPAQDIGIFTGKRILVADDVDINREILQALIEHTGVSIDNANDGEEALELFSANPGDYDLILMDVQMPRMDGYEATRRIRASGLPGAETIPIYALTANVFREDREACLACGANGHLGKPIDVDTLMETLRTCLL
jgi:CheY-like chemotaxis protein